jgi:hypothetical protein
MVMMTTRSPDGASVSVMSKNHTIVGFSAPRRFGFHAKKLGENFNSTIGRTANRNVIQILRGVIRHRR